MTRDSLTMNSLIMNSTRLYLTLFATLVLSACKVEISVPNGGRVESVSGAYRCDTGETCTLEVVDLFFDETFRAIPKSGYRFSHWANHKNGGFMCGDGTEPCRLNTGPLENNPDLMAVLESDQAFALRPVFVARPCDLSGVNTDSSRQVLLNNGRGTGSASNRFDDPNRALGRLTVRDRNCGSGGDPYSSCAFAGDATEASLAACSVVHDLIISDTSRITIDRGVVLERLQMLGKSQVNVAAGDVNDVASFGISRLTINAGDVGAVHALESSEVAVVGGITRDLEAIDEARIEVSGGQVNAITAFDSGRIAITGGDLRVLKDKSQSPFAGYIEAQGRGEVTLSGGTLNAGTVGNRKDGNLILTFEQGRITIEGSNFSWSNASGTVVDQPLPNGRLPNIVGWLSGTLANGETFTNVFWEQKTGSDIVLAAPSN